MKNIMENPLCRNFQTITVKPTVKTKIKHINFYGTHFLYNSWVQNTCHFNCNELINNPNSIKGTENDIKQESNE